MASLSIPLDTLRFGHEAVPPINVRQVGRDADIAPLADSIRAHGLIQHLEIQRTDDGIFVADGNRRLAALKQLASTGELAPDHPIACAEVEAGADPLEISLAANVMRSALHPADEYVAFVDLSDNGLGEDEIARRFGIPPKRVRRILALGRLSPKIIDAWRTGLFERDEIDCVRAFTLASSLAEQDKVFDRLQKQRYLHPHAITTAFGAGDRSAVRHLNFVGKTAYRTAGGHLVEDLFGDNHVVADPPLAKRLSDEKLASICASLIEEGGWLWAAPEWELPQGASWNWSRTEKKPGTPKKAIKARMDELAAMAKAGTLDDAGRDELDAIEAKLQSAAYPADLRARAGVIVGITHQGRLELKPGYLKPEKAKPAKGEDEAPNEKKAPAISNAMMERLSVQLTLATRKALEAEPIVGLSALLAGFLSHEPYRDPIRVRQSGYRSDVVVSLEDRESFADVFKRILAMGDDARLRLAAGIAGQAVDLVRVHVDNPPLADPAITVMLNAMDGAGLSEALAAGFDAANYFGSVSKPLVLDALREAGFADQQATTSKMAKADLVAFAVAHVPKTGWLPPQLRTIHYAGPGRAG